MKKGNNHKIKANKILILFIILLVLIVMLFIGYNLLNSNDNSYYQPDSRVKQSQEYTIEDAKTVGWLQVQGTNIDYPVIKETENAYTSGIDYLWQPNVYRDGENREVIYGHNILNVSSNPLINEDGHTRFEPLMGFVYKEFAQQNLYIQYTYDGKDYLYKIYAIGFVSTSDEQGYSMSDKETIKNYIYEAKKNSLYDYDIDVNENDRLISLVTCTRYFGLSGKTQFRVDAREVRKNEKIKKYSVYTTQNYDIIK